MPRHLLARLCRPNSGNYSARSRRGHRPVIEPVLAQLVASKVALPDHTAGVPLLDVLPPSVADMWRSSEGLLGMAANGPPVQPYMGVSPSEYPLLIRRLVGAGRHGRTPPLENWTDD